MKDLHNLIHNIQQSCGIYQFYDAQDRLLYVGKAKDLNKRVKSYFIKSANLSPRVISMVAQVCNIKTLVTNSEQDALILENALIKASKPKYNILLRDDKTYPYLYVDRSEDFPTLSITRKIIKKPKVEYFGPFSSGARELLDSILQTNKLVQKKSCLKGKRGCLFYQINRCSAPCEQKISKEQYAKILQDSLELIYNKKKLLAMLESKMLTFAQCEAYEEASKIRDKIKKITQMQIHSGIDLADLSNYDIFVILTPKVAMDSHKNTNQKVIVFKLFVRDGRVNSSDYIITQSNLLSYKDEIYALYTQALLSHYAKNPPILPNAILLPNDIGEFDDKQKLQNFLYEKFNKKIPILQPIKGKKAELIALANNNALEILRLEEVEVREYDATLADIKDFFALSHTPYRIEVFDTSHHSGKQCVGGMIVFENNEFIKQSYRHFSLQAHDENGQMRELLTRRALKFDENPPPDCWLIDGGSAQLNLAQEIVQSSGANIDIIAIAKHKIAGRAHRAKGSANDILHSHKGIHKLSTNDKKLQFFQKLRDEAHRFAITFHRTKKLKDLTHIKILALKRELTHAQIEKLLRIYGSIKTIENLDEGEIKNALRSKNIQNKA